MEQDGSSVSVDGNDTLLISKHKIFLSHSGAQKDFVKQLCVDIEACDRYPFFDIRRHSLPIGVHFPNEIFEAIKQCQVGVLILSKEFFTRTKWPMLEFTALVHMKNQNDNFIIMPVFLGITHEECCKKINHAQWLSKWEEWARLDKRINIQEWIGALQILGPTNGISYNSVTGEVKCRKEIVQAICELVPPETRWDDFHVQGKERLCKVINQHFEGARVSSTYKTQVVGLYGVGGIGKTTACKVLCNYFFKEFQDKVCHIEFHNDSEPKFLESMFLKSLHTMMKKLTSIKDEIFSKFDIGECIYRLKKTLSKNKVFLAIDNVYDSTPIIDQTKTLLKLGYSEGSKVLVVARSFDLLQLFNLHDMDCIEMPELNEEEAKSLFLYQISISPSRLYDEAIKICMERCHFRKGHGSNSHYHPLALKVLSMQLGNDPNTWMLNLKNLDAFNHFRENEHPLFSILRKSFDNLLRVDQDLFMDVVLFFPQDNNHETWTNIFKWLSMVHGKTTKDIERQLDNLKRKSLIESVGDGSRRIGIHDLWREFCIKETTMEETKNYGLWLYEEYDPDCNYIESNLSIGGWENLSRICLKGSDSKKMIIKELDLYKCSELKVLKLVNLGLDSIDLSQLKLLRSLEILQTATPISIYGLELLKHLVVLKLDFLSTKSRLIEEIGSLTRLQVLQLNSNKNKDSLFNIEKLIWLQELMISKFWDGIDMTALGLNSKMRQFETLKVSNCSSLQNSNGLHELVTLKSLSIKLCPMLEEVYNTRHLQMMKALIIEDCKGIISLSGIEHLVALEKFILVACKNLTELPNLKNLNHLKILYIESCKSIKTLPGLEELTALDDLRLEDCENLLEVPDLSGITRLRILSIEYCKSIKALVGIEDLIFLEEFILKSCESLTKAPNFYKLQKLRLLYIEDCKLIASLPNLGNLKGLEELELKYLKNLSYIPDLQKMKRLQILNLEGCKSIQALIGLNDIISLKSLTLNGCENLIEISNLQNLEDLQVLYMEGCKSITTLHGLDKLSALDDLRLNGCKNLQSLLNLQNLEGLRLLYMEDCKSIKRLSGLDNLITLKHLILNLGYCENLEELPNLQKLQNLHLLYMEDCMSLKELQGLEDLTALKDLRLKAWKRLEVIPNIQQLEKLQVLNIENCLSIRRLPELSNLISLEYIVLNGCENLEEIFDLEHMEKLRLLSLEGCKSIISLPSLSNLKALEDLNLNGCENLRDIPDLQKLKRLRLLNIEGCKFITTLPGLCKCIALEDLRLNACRSLKSLSNFGKVKRLKILYMEGCISIKSLLGLGKLISLNDIRLNSCENLEVFSNLKSLENLQILHMEGCTSIKILSGLEELISLKELVLRFCDKITELPNLQKLKQLRLLYVDGCKLITTLPGLGHLIVLEQLHIDKCVNLADISDIYKLINLGFLSMIGCKLTVNLHKLPIGCICRL